MSDSSAMIVVTCDCGQKMKIPEVADGKTFKCVRCGSLLKSGGEVGPTGGAQRPPQAPATPTVPDGTPDAQEPIGQLLTSKGLVTEAQLQDALEKQKSQGGKTFELLIALGHLDKDKLHDFLSRQPGIAAIDLSRCSISQDLVQLVPKKLAVENLVLPIDQIGKLLTVAMACPLDTGTIATLEKATGLRVKAMLCKLEDIHSAVQKYYPERSRMEMSPSSFDHILGAADGPKEKIEEKVANWNGVFVSEERKASLVKSLESESSLDKIARLILGEPSLGALLMRVANSDIYGMCGRIESVPMAVAVLGKGGVLQVIDQLVDTVAPNVLAPLESMYYHSRQTAAIAQGLARESGVVGENGAFSLGMLGEMGRIALATISPMKYKRVKPHLFGAALSESEAKYFSMNHAEAGGAIAEAWHYPPQLVRAIRHYITPDDAKDSAPLARLLGLAIAMSYTVPESLPGLLSAEAATLDALNISPAAARGIVNEVQGS